MNLFGAYRRLIWPIQRRFVKLTPRCPRCILQSDGLCEECLTYKPEPEPSSETPRSSSPQALNLPDRAVVMVSGGKDSAYTLWRLLRDYPETSIIAITIDNGFIDQGVKNAAYCCAKLGVDHVIIRSLKDLFVDRYKIALQNYVSAYKTFDWADGQLIFLLAEKYAAGLPLISGISKEQAEMIVGVDGHTHGNCIFPLAAWNVSESEIYSTIRQHNLLPKGKEHVGVTNNRLIPTLCALDVKKNGFCSFEPEFANLVRKGKADRKEWLTTFEILEYGAKKVWFDRQINKVMAEVGVTAESSSPTIQSQQHLSPCKP